MIDIKIKIPANDIRELDGLSNTFKTAVTRALKRTNKDAVGISKGTFGKPGHVKNQTGALKASIIGNSTDKQSSLTSDLIYAAIHENSGKYIPFLSTSLVKSMNNFSKYMAEEWK